MLMYGTNLLSPADKLSYVDVKSVYGMIRDSNSDLRTQIDRMRMVKQIDVKQYSSLKRMLPYFVCGCFNQPFRRTENFAYTEFFILDIDHLSSKGFALSDIRLLLQKDRQVMMSFVSPGKDGLKLLFKLSTRCYDAGVFSLFYKVFSKNFSERYNLGQAIDSRTCDVTRACFLSYDANVYFNEEAEMVDMNQYVNQSDAQSLLDVKWQMEKQELASKEVEYVDIESVKIADPDEMALSVIKRTLSEVKNKKKESSIIYVPKILDDIISELRVAIEKTEIIVEEILNIQYGKKLRVKLGMRLGEINLFYGKRGFSVVQSPKRGTSCDLNQVTADVINCFLAGY